MPDDPIRAGARGGFGLDHQLGDTSWPEAQHRAIDRIGHADNRNPLNESSGSSIEPIPVPVGLHAATA